MIQAIPTTYANVTFRSKLEARWAMYFDLLGIDWIYEPIVTKNYIPDFYLTKLQLFCEVKPYEPTTYDDRWLYFVSEVRYELKQLGFFDEKEPSLVLLFGKVNCFPYKVIRKDSISYIGLGHVDSKFSGIYYVSNEKDNKLVKENQVFCDDVNNYVFKNQ